MKLFITGGTGVLGKRLVPHLVKMGYNLGVLARSEDKKSWIEQQGAIAISISLFDREAISKAYAILIKLFH